MKNGSRESRVTAKGSFGGSRDVRERNFSVVKSTPTGDVRSFRVAVVGRDAKGAANAKLVRKLHRQSSLF